MNKEMKLFFIFSDSCTFKESDKFYVTFHNSYVHPIDIKRLYPNEKLQRTKLLPQNEVTVQTKFTHVWAFMRSETQKRLMVTGNGVKSQNFEGCKYQAKPNDLITVNIFGGKKQLDYRLPRFANAIILFNINHNRAVF